MYILNKNISRIHFIESLCYVFMNDDFQFIKANEVETIFLKECLNTNDLSLIIRNINDIYKINDDVLVSNTIKNVIETLDMCVKITDECNNSFYDILVTGESEKKFPKTIQIYLTNQCPHKCIHCFKGCVEKIINIDQSVLFSMLDFIKFKTPQIQLTGGEPLLYPHIYELIEQYSKYFDIYITTSGYYLNNRILKLLTKCKEIQISLYSHIEDVHNNFVKNDNSFLNITKNIDILVSHNINVGISHIVTPFNYFQIEDFIKYCILLKVNYIKFSNIIPLGRAKDKKEYILTPQIKEKVKYSILKLKEKYKKEIYIFAWEGNNYGIKNNNFICGAGSISWSINEKGDIYPCAMLECDQLKKGNIYNKDYINIINNSMKEKYNKRFSDIKINDITIDKICGDHE